MTETLVGYTEQLYSMMRTNQKFDEWRFVFGAKAVDIGHKIYEAYGANGLFDSMRLLCDRVLYKETVHQKQYFTDLRELECAWSGITEDFQCYFFRV